jgi:hypothetical protein
MDSKYDKPSSINPWIEYERMKREIVRRYPHPEAYEAAIRELLRKLGL